MSVNTKTICLNIEKICLPACLPPVLSPPCQTSAVPGCASRVKGQKRDWSHEILVTYTPPRAFQDIPFSAVVVREMLSQRITDLGSATERNICRRDSSSTPVISMMLQRQKSAQAIITLLKDELFIE